MLAQGPGPTPVREEPAAPPSQPRGWRSYLILFLKGGAMGSADVVPGVSGGTMALILGIYDRLIRSICHIGSRRVLLIFRRGGIAEFWRSIDGAFLLALALGIGTALYLLSGVITHLLDTQPVLIFAFFFGLILASIWAVALQVGKWRWWYVLCLLAGVAAGFFISTATPVYTPTSALAFFLAGMIAITAMILPGISGSFILLLLGKYRPVLGAVQAIDLTVLLPFALGAGVGILAFSHLLNFLLRRFHALTMALLAGFIAGAIVRVWPWQGGGEGGLALLTPSQYAAQGRPDHLLPALGLVAVGFLVVFLIERAGRRSGAEAR